MEMSEQEKVVTPQEKEKTAAQPEAKKAQPAVAKEVKPAAQPVKKEEKPATTVAPKVSAPTKKEAPKAKSAPRGKRKNKKVVVKGVAHIHCSFNNTVVTISDEQGNVVAWSSSGALGYKGSKKSTPFAAQMAAEAAGKAALDFGMRTINVDVKGPGPGREQAVRALEACGLSIVSISDVTPVPHNGCRPPKRPRR